MLEERQLRHAWGTHGEREGRGECFTRCAAAATAILINKQGSPLEGAIWWAMSTAFSPDGTFKVAIDSQG